MKNLELVPSFKESLFSNTMDVGIDIIEVGIDQIIENDVLKEVPIVGTIVKLGKTAITIKDRHLLKKTLFFIEQINNGSISEELLNNHKNELELNPNKMKKELEHIIVLIDRYIECKKTIILANFYKNYIGKRIDWEDFKVLAEILDVLSLYDIDTLKDINNKKFYKETDEINKLALIRLGSNGLIDYFNGMTVSNGKELKNIIAKINDIGIAFIEYGLSNTLDNCIG